MRNVKIQVTQKDLRPVRGSWFTNCPIARAARRVFGKRFEGVSRFGIYLNSSGGFSQYILLTLKARLFVAQFDRGGIVKPFTFTVKVRE